MICPTCGEHISDELDECPHCETPISPLPPKRTGMAVINLKDGRPTVDVARDRLDAAIRNHQTMKTEGLVLIHGYGSTGAGGVIKQMVHEHLRHLKHGGEIQDFVRGEDIGHAQSARYPHSFQPSRSDVGNRGITVVKL